LNNFLPRGFILKISQNSVVTIQYTLTNDLKEVLDRSSAKDPLVYLHGTGSLIPGLEQSLEAHVAGEKLNVTVKPEDGYGVRNDKMLQNVQKSEFPKDEVLAVGMRFQVSGEDGPMVLTVVEIKDEEVIVDANHPLAGVNLHFDVEIMDVRAATENELSHGHAHGPGDHHH
jgi:FKBP-type peptidyl-prolyl cis-trans isomerase SlyD